MPRNQRTIAVPFPSKNASLTPHAKNPERAHPPPDPRRESSICPTHPTAKNSATKIARPLPYPSRQELHPAKNSPKKPKRHEAREGGRRTGTRGGACCSGRVSSSSRSMDSSSSSPPSSSSLFRRLGQRRRGFIWGYSASIGVGYGLRGTVREPAS